MHAVLRAAAAVGAELVLLPELSVTGLLPNHPVGDHAASLAAALVRMSSSEGVFLAAGMLENAGRVLHNKNALVAEGASVGLLPVQGCEIALFPFRRIRRRARPRRRRRKRGLWCRRGAWRTGLLGWRATIAGGLRLRAWSRRFRVGRW